MTAQAITINVDRTEVSQRGQRNNRPWVKYLVYGTRADGSPIATDGLPVFTFDKLAKGEVEVTLEEFFKGNAAFRESWTVKRVREPKAARPAGGDTTVIDHDELDDLRERVEQLESLTRRMATKLRLEEATRA